MSDAGRIIREDLRFIAEMLDDQGRRIQAKNVLALADDVFDGEDWDTTIIRARANVQNYQNRGARFPEDTLEMINTALSKPRNI